MTNFRVGVRARWAGTVSKGYKPLAINQLLKPQKPDHISDKRWEALPLQERVKG